MTHNKSNMTYLLLIGVVTVIPWLCLLGIFVFTTTDVPYMDQWELVPLLQKTGMGQLQLHDFWVQHNEHRLVFPKLIMLALARFSLWNVNYELAANFILGTLLFLLLFTDGFLETLKRQSRQWWGMAAVLSLLLFSPSQWGNWFLGWQLQVFLNLLMVALTCFILVGKTQRWGRFCIGTLCAVVATYSFANGVLIWPVGLLLLLLSESEKSKKYLLMLWIIMGFSCIALYLSDYTSPEYHPEMSAVLYHPVAFMEYVFVYLGQPLVCWQATGALMAGLAGLLLFAGTLITIDLSRVPRTMWLPFVGLALYALGSALITALARMEYGPEQAMSSRYVSIANFLWVANLGLILLSSVGKTAKRSAFRFVLLCLITFTTGFSFLSGLRTWDMRYPAYRKAREILMEQEDLEGIPYIYPDAQRLQERRDWLRANRLGIFRDLPAKPGMDDTRDGL